MTTVSIADIKLVLHNLLNKQLTFEEASNWAYDLTVKDDYRTLQYEPADDEPIIWEAVKFLQAADLKTAPGVYLLGMEDIKYLLNQIKNR